MNEDIETIYLYVLQSSRWESKSNDGDEAINRFNRKKMMMQSSECNYHQIKDGFDCGIDSANDLGKADGSEEILSFSKKNFKSNSNNLSSSKEEFIGRNPIERFEAKLILTYLFHFKFRLLLNVFYS